MKKLAGLGLLLFVVEGCAPEASGQSGRAATVRAGSYARVHEVVTPTGVRCVVVESGYKAGAGISCDWAARDTGEDKP